jgi:competence protein ComEA
MSQTFFKSHSGRHLAAMKTRALTLLLVAFCHALAGLSVSCVKLPRRAQTTAEESNAQREPNTTPRLNINTATSAELERLPGIGPAFAARIITQRERYGPFRRVEHLLIVPGISERRFAEIRPFVTVQ